MKIVIELRTDNAAFEDNLNEIREILTDAVVDIADWCEGYGTQTKTLEGKLLDSNGNTVGKFKVTGR